MHRLGNFQCIAEHAICLCLAPRPFRLSQVKGDRRYTSLYTKGDISITPAGTPFFAQWDGNDRYLWIRIPSHFTHKVAKEAVEIDPHQVELLPEFRVRNPFIEQIGMMLLAELKNGGLAGRLYIESLTNVLAVQLLRNYSATQPSVSLYSGGLSDSAKQTLRERQLLVVTDYIHEYLSEEIKLSELSEILLKNSQRSHYPSNFLIVPHSRPQALLLLLEEFRQSVVARLGLIVVVHPAEVLAEVLAEVHVLHLQSEFPDTKAILATLPYPTS